MGLGTLGLEGALERCGHSLQMCTEVAQGEPGLNLTRLIPLMG